MKKAPIPANEAARLADLQSYEILDSIPEIGFDDITELASAITGKPIALVSLIDKDRQWFKSKQGLSAPETPRDVSFCGHAIHGTEVFEVPDAFADPRFADNPLVTGAPNVVFYAGVPLTSPQGFNLGTLCVIDNQAGHLSPEQKAQLQRLARQVVAQMELRKKALAFSRKATEAEEANRALAKANAAKAEFIANMNHEIRTPLNAISGALQILEDQSTTSDGKGVIAMAMTGLDTVLQLVNNVLDMAKIDAGLMVFSRDPTDIVKTTQSIKDMFLGSAQGKNVKIEVEIKGSKSHTFMTDELRIKQVLMNIIGNALKFTPSNGLVNVQVDIAKQNDNFIATWTIKDSGIGMTQATLTKLCQPFEQGDANIQKKFGGSGLGLALVKRIIDSLKGTLQFESKLGKGTTVTIAIPFVAYNNEKLEPKSPENDSNLAACETLIVDDNSVNRLVLSRLLGKLGFTIVEATSGLEAIDKFRQMRPTLVMLDIQMPDIDGFEVLKNIRAFEASTPNLAKSFVVAVTGQGFEEDIKKCLDAGFDGHVSKPVAKAELVKALKMRPSKVQ